MDSSLSAYITDNKSDITNELMKTIGSLAIPNRLKDAMLYSVKAGGKRIRPILMIACCEAYNGRTEDVKTAALALEMIHTYSLIHDDLPAMDDDDYRRGLPTNHRKFDEATAILAGDGLLTASFELITNDVHLNDEQKVYIIKRLAACAGPEGMVAGQALDMEAENQAITIEELERIHHLKTGQLLIFALEIGAYIGGADPTALRAIKECGYNIGLLFQIQDDILDVNGDPEKIGKSIGSDETNDKSTYPKLLGLKGAIEQKDTYVYQAKQALMNANVATSRLATLIDYLSEREG